MQSHHSHIHRLLWIGALIFLVSYSVSFFIDPTSWEYWWIQNGFHVLGGAYAFYFFRTLFLYERDRHSIVMPWGGVILISIGGALVIGAVWEWYELIIDRYTLFVLHVPSIMTYADTVGDLIFDTIGASLVGVSEYLKHGKEK